MDSSTQPLMSGVAGSTTGQNASTNAIRSFSQSALSAARSSRRCNSALAALSICAVILDMVAAPS